MDSRRRYHAPVPSYRFLKVDVFTNTPLRGNPLAVFPDARGLDDAAMQSIAREMNLSETTFVLPPSAEGADYRVRIFTPRSELPFAGHPTIGTAHAMLEAGAVRLPPGRTLWQQTAAGIQAIEVNGERRERRYVMTQPVPSFAAAPPLADVAVALRVPPEAIIAEPLIVSIGIRWIVAPLRDLGTVRNLDPDLSAVERFVGVAGVTAFCPEAADPACRIRVRTFAPREGIAEDPVCGSCNGCVGAYLARTGLVGPPPLSYVAEQGVEIGRDGRVFVDVDGGEKALRLRVGGQVITVMDGELRLVSKAGA